MRAALHKLAGAGALVLVGLGALVLGFLALTVIGLGGGSDEGPAAPAQASEPAIVLDPTKVTSGPTLVQRSESIGLRESAGAGDPTAPKLSENVPFTEADFDEPIAQYRRYAARQARQLAPQVAALTAAIDAGKRSAAQARWREAFERYLRLGAVYGAFGELDTRIDGLPGGLPRGAADPGFTGLHRIEQGLWTDAPVRSVSPAAHRLQRDVTRLQRAIRTSEITPLDYSLRAHEILEGAQIDFLTGVAVPWSDEGVLATASSLEATAVVLRTLHPLLQGKPTDGSTAAGVERMRRTLASLRAAHGDRYPTLSTLSRRERQHLVGSTGALLEALQAVPPSTETTDPVPVPKMTTP